MCVVPDHLVDGQRRLAVLDEDPIGAPGGDGPRRGPVGIGIAGPDLGGQVDAHRVVGIPCRGARSAASG